MDIEYNIVSKNKNFSLKKGGAKFIECLNDKDTDKIDCQPGEAYYNLVDAVLFKSDGTTTGRRSKIVNRKRRRKEGFPRIQLSDEIPIILYYTYENLLKTFLNSRYEEISSIDRGAVNEKREETQVQKRRKLYWFKQHFGYDEFYTEKQTKIKKEIQYHQMENFNYRVKEDFISFKISQYEPLYDNKFIIDKKIEERINELCAAFVGYLEQIMGFLDYHKSNISGEFSRPDVDFELKVSPLIVEKSETKSDVSFQKITGTKQFNFLGKAIRFYISINKMDKNTIVSLKKKNIDDNKYVAYKEGYYYNINMECIDNLISFYIELLKNLYPQNKNEMFSIPFTPEDEGINLFEDSEYAKQKIRAEIEEVSDEEIENQKKLEIQQKPLERKQIEKRYKNKKNISAIKQEIRAIKEKDLINQYTGEEIKKFNKKNSINTNFVENLLKYVLYSKIENNYNLQKLKEITQSIDERKDKYKFFDSLSDIDKRLEKLEDDLMKEDIIKRNIYNITKPETNKSDSLTNREEINLEMSKRRRTYTDIDKMYQMRNFLLENITEFFNEYKNITDTRDKQERVSLKTAEFNKQIEDIDTLFNDLKKFIITEKKKAIDQGDEKKEKEFTENEKFINGFANLNGDLRVIIKKFDDPDFDTKVDSYKQQIEKQENDYKQQKLEYEKTIDKALPKEKERKKDNIRQLKKLIKDYKSAKDKNIKQQKLELINALLNKFPEEEIYKKELKKINFKEIPIEQDLLNKFNLLIQGGSYKDYEINIKKSKYPDYYFSKKRNKENKKTKKKILYSSNKKSKLSRS